MSKVLVVIPARANSKRIRNKNMRRFLGKPLIAYAIQQALGLHFIDRVVVDTDSERVAQIARKYGAEVPFLRPKFLATDQAQVVDSLIYLLKRLKSKENYVPDYIMILQTTSPLREIEDIYRAWNLMKKGGADTVLTVAPTHPRIYRLNEKDCLVLTNRSSVSSTNIQAWPNAYLLNGCFVYVMRSSGLLKNRQIITNKTKAIICDKWRSVDLDNPEDWVLAELLYKNRGAIKKRIASFNN